MLTLTAQSGSGQSVLVQDPRDPMRGSFYFGYFYFYFTNTAPFRAAGSVMPG